MGDRFRHRTTVPMPLKLGLPMALATMFAAAPATGADAPVRIVFASGPDDTGTIKAIVEAFNTKNEGSIQVKWRTMPRDNNAHHRELVESLGGPKADLHVVASDVIWTAELAKKKWILDLTARFYDSFDADDWLEPALSSTSFRLRKWAIPWYTDVSLLFYRKDLLAKSGFDAPPKTWAELEKMAQKVMKDAGVKTGFVFQGAAYEGGAANALEFIWSAGGRAVTTGLRPAIGFSHVDETETIRIDSPNAARGLDIARGLIDKGVVPAEVVRYRERESLQVFAAKDAVFMRNWPYAVGVLKQAGFGDAELGIAPLPGATEEQPGFSCLGGWNLAINARSSTAEQGAAWTFIRYLTSPEVQKRQAVQASLLPVLVALYSDAEVARSAAALRIGRDVLANRLRGRPSAPFYSQMSAELASAFQAVLEGRAKGEQVVENLDRTLRAAAIRNR